MIKYNTELTKVRNCFIFIRIFVDTQMNQPAESTVHTVYTHTHARIHARMYEYMLLHLISL